MNALSRMAGSRASSSAAVSDWRRFRAFTSACKASSSATMRRWSGSEGSGSVRARMFPRLRPGLPCPYLCPSSWLCPSGVRQDHRANSGSTSDVDNRQIATCWLTNPGSSPSRNKLTRPTVAPVITKSRSPTCGIALRPCPPAGGEMKTFPASKTWPAGPISCAR